MGIMKYLTPNDRSFFGKKRARTCAGEEIFCTFRKKFQTCAFIIIIMLAFNFLMVGSFILLWIQCIIRSGCV